MKLILLGPPGAGKGTQSKVLAKKLGVKHVSTGDILREAIKNDTPLGKEAKKYVESGELVPDELVTKMVVERLLMPDVAAGFILDGFPRNTRQAEDLDAFFNKKGIIDAKVFYLEAREEVLIQRLSGRRICPKCQAVFHIKNMPPKKGSLCDFCSTELIQRPDDQEATIRNRLSVYARQTAPVIDYYANEGRLIRIAADKEADTVIDNIFKILKR